MKEKVVIAALALSTTFLGVSMLNRSTSHELRDLRIEDRAMTLCMKSPNPFQADFAGCIINTMGILGLNN